MTREKILNELTLVETAEYRRRGLALSGKYRHEPSGFRNALHAIFNKLNDEDLETLYNLKTNNHGSK